MNPYLARYAAKQPHGHLARYIAGCRCDICRSAETDRKTERNRAFPAPRNNWRWTGAEMQVAMDRRPDGSYVRGATEVANLLGRTREAVKRVRFRCNNDPKYQRVVLGPR